MVGRGEELIDLYGQMNSIEIPLDRFTYTYVLKASLFQSCQSALCRRVRRFMPIFWDMSVKQIFMTTLLDVYAKFDSVSFANPVFCPMPAKNFVSWEYYDCLSCK
ncbi:Pentatricopeptide repeat-containing protein [Spatholobus suberectus]|nr:Pentatricopeptide repeat-containing protein [Spatholobus suberectus]